MTADPLLAMQRQVLAALREPLHGDSRRRTELPPRADDASPAFVATAHALFTPSATLDPVARLELYHQQYWYRLLDSLAEDFPAVRQVLGARAFGTLLEGFLEAVAPSTSSLRHVGAGLAAFVAAHPAAVPHAAHVAELANLEYAWLAAFDAAERPPAAPALLATRTLGLQPHLTLFGFRTAADTLWRRARDARPRERLGPVAATPTRFVAVSRDGLHRRVERLHPAAHALLTAVAATGSLDRAIDAALPQLPTRGAEALVTSWFEAWTRRGWLVVAAPAAAPLD